MTEQAERPFLLSIDVARGRITVHGDLDRQHVPRLMEAVGVLEHSPSPTWSIDVSGVDFCDAGGLRGLLEARRWAHMAGRDFVVARPSRWLRLLMHLIDWEAVDRQPAS